MPIPLIQTKLHRPPVARDNLHRQHLLDRLNARRHRPLTLVSAPAGYGKSTLLSSWLESCQCISGWVSLDATDSDLRTFMAYLVGAIDDMFPGSTGDTQSLLKGTDLPPLEMLATGLINEVAAIAADFILVLDDYHTIRDTAVHELIQQLLIHPPHNMHLAVATRRDPPFPIVELRARAKVTEIRAQDLRFSPREVKYFLQKVMQVEVDEPVAAVIEEKTEGWVAGLRLAVLSMRHRSDLQRMVTNLPDNNRYVMDYIISEVISQQPAEIRDYLLSTAILDRFCAPLCDAVCISEQSPSTCTLSGNAFIDNIQQANMFCIPLDDKQKWFRFHHLFRQLLQRELKRQYGEKTIHNLHDRAGSWYEQNELLDEALMHFLLAKNTTAARQLVVDRRYDLTAHEQWHRLQRWFMALPREKIDIDPGLLIVLAWIHENRERLPEMRQTLDRIDALLDEKADEKSVYTEIMGEYNALRSSQYYLLGDTKRARHYADHAVKQIPCNHISERAFALLIWALVHQMDGDANEARKVIYGAMRADETNGSTYTTRLLLTLCILDWLEGDLSGLQQNARQLLAVGKDHNLLESIAFANYHLGLAAYYFGDSQQALPYLETAVKIGRLVDPNTHLHASCALGLTYQTIGRPEKARELFQEMIEYALKVQNTALLQISKAFGAELAFRQGRVSEALGWAREFAFDPLGQTVRFLLPQLTQAKILLMMGSAEDRMSAHSMLDRMHRFFAEKHNKQCLIEILALRAIGYSIKNEPPAALEALTAALDLAHRSRRIEPFRSSGNQMTTLLKQVAHQGRFEAYIAQILAAIAVTSAPVISDAENPEADSQQPTARQMPPEENPLTNREIDIVQLLNQRLSNKEIAAKLFISPSTVKRHTINIYKKLGASNRQEAVVRARELGVVEAS